jgi:glycerate-2-kinase
VALDVAAAGVAALDPASAVDRHLSRDGNALMVGGRRFDPPGRVVVIGAGKASYRIAKRVEEILGDRVAGGLVVVRRAEGGPLHRIEVMEADHPLPTEASVAAGKAALALADELGPEDLALCCITGGSSALLCAPPASVSFDRKRDLHRRLLASGAAIDEMNAVRKHVSEIKGGRLAARIAPATVVNFTVSDVRGDVLDLITGPTVQDSTTPADAVAVLKRRSLWDLVDASVREHLASPSAVSPDLAGVRIETRLILASHEGCRAMEKEAVKRGYLARVYSSVEANDEAADVGRRIAAAARGALGSADPAALPVVLIACGGESTVTLDPHPEVFGDSGPNQEVVLAAAVDLQGIDRVVVLSMDTDGSDGGTAFAGGIADGQTVLRARQAGIDAAAHLQFHTAGAVLAQLGDLLETGPTGTNVNDLVVVVVGAGSP